MDDDTLKMFVLTVFGMMVLVLSVGAFLVVRDTIRGRGRWGLNFRLVSCPECGEPAPTIRAPKNVRQALWGGCTCTHCGTEYDKWGQVVEDEAELNEKE